VGDVSIVWDDAELNAMFRDVGEDAVRIAADFTVETARPLVRVLRTRPPGRREQSYSLPAGRLRESLRWVIAADYLGPMAVLLAAVPVGAFQGLNPAGKRYGQPAYGGSRAHTRAYSLALEALDGATVTRGGVARL
jgi:hypothetical protein